MNFICSVNTNVLQALDAVSGKIEAGGDYSSFNSGWEAKKLSSNQIAEEVAQSKDYVLGI